MMHTIPYKSGYIHLTQHDGQTIESVRAQLADGRSRECPSIRSARKWITEESNRMHWKDFPPMHRDQNPKLDYYDEAGKYLFSSTHYQCIPHAWAHNMLKNVARIVHSTKS